MSDDSNKNNGMKYAGIGLSFGVGTAARIYLLGILGGGWLDEYFHVNGWFSLVGIIVAIVLSFYSLIKSFSQIDHK